MCFPHLRDGQRVVEVAQGVELPLLALHRNEELLDALFSFSEGGGGLSTGAGEGPARRLGTKQHAKRPGLAAPTHTSRVSSSRLTRMRTGSVMNCCVIWSTSTGSVADTTTTWQSGGRYLAAAVRVRGSGQPPATGRGACKAVTSARL